MKKQKFCYSRFLSIILSLALLCSALVFPVSVNAENTPADPKAAAAENLKTAWKEMYAAKGESFAYPNAILSDGWKNTDKTLLPSDNPKMDLYADINLVDYTSKVQVVYGKEIHAAADKPYCNICIDSKIHSEKTGFYFYVYAENLTEDVTLNFGFNWGGTIAGEKPYTIHKGTNGYVRIEDTDLFNNYKTSLETTRIDTIWVTIQSGFGSGNLKFGSLYWKNSNTNLDSDTGLYLEGLAPDQLLVSALKLHTENVYYPEYVEKFETALADLKDCYDAKELAVLELRAAWEEIETNTAEYANFYSSGSTASSNEQKGKLGTYYYQLDTSTLVDTNTSHYSNKKYIVWQDQKENKSITQKSGDGFYFYIYVDKEITAPITLTLNANWTSSCNNNAELYYTIPAGTTAGTYIKVTDRDLFTEGYKTLYEKYSDQANFNLFFTSKGQGTISVGSVFRYKRAASSNATGVDFVNWELDRCVNYLLRDINENSLKTTDEFNALFEEVKQMCAGKLYNGDFSGANSGYQLNTKPVRTEDDAEGNPVVKETATEYSFNDGNLVYNVDGWNKNLFDTYFSVEKNTNYVLTYRYKSGTKNDKWQAFGVGLLDGSGRIINGEITHNNADIFTDSIDFDNTNWINGLCNTNNTKWINVSISFNSGENTFLKLNAASMGRNQYTIDYFKLTKAVDVKQGNVNGDSEVDILDLVVLNEFLNDGDTEIAFEAAKVNNAGTTVDDYDFNALRSKLLNSNS